MVTTPSIPEDLQPVANSLTGASAKFVKLTTTLAELIARETSFLKERKPREAQQLHGEKSRLMAEYKETMNQLKVNEHLLGPEDSNIRRYIKAVTDHLREILRDHARIVLRLKSVAEGLIKSVGEEVAKQSRPVVGYSNRAGYQMPQAHRPMSMSLNQVI